MKLALAVLVLAIGCKDDRLAKQQEQFDRSVERAGGLERDVNGRSYNMKTGKYLDARGGSVIPQDRAPGDPYRVVPTAEPVPAADPMAALPPDPPETDVTRGQAEEWVNGDKKKAKQLYDKACKEKVSGGCAYAVLIDRDKDADKAAKGAKALCDGGDAAGCFAQAMIYETTVGKEKHEAAEVIALYDKSCTGGFADACNALGMVYHSGRGGAPQDKQKAAEALKRGCALGDRQSCLQVGMVQR